MLVLDINKKTFVVHIAIQKQKKIPIYLEKQFQIKSKTKDKVQIRALLFNKVFIKILIKYFKYSNIFSAKNIAKLLEHIEINNYAIKLEKKQQ